MAVGKAGAGNAGLLAAEILSLSDAALRRRLSAYRQRMAKEVEERSRRLPRTK
jgi:5-(carboxyamino)imidazole ribonucleotide mutase